MARVARDKLSVEWIKLELLRTAYATRGGLLARMDPRMVLAWYLLLAIVPWFTHNITVLALLFGLGVVSVIVARVGPLILGLFVFGLITDGVYIGLTAWLFDGNTGTILALLELTLKLGAVSLASMAAFVSLDPEKLSDALLSLGAPSLVSFGVSYGYRMLPILMEEFHTIVDGHRLRSAAPASPGFLGHRSVVRFAKILVFSFYPMMLNTAKRTRTTVEALETKGFTFAGEHAAGRTIRLAYLRVGSLDVAVLAGTIAIVVGIFAVGAVHPWYI